MSREDFLAGSLEASIIIDEDQEENEEEAAQVEDDLSTGHRISFDNLPDEPADPALTDEPPSGPDDDTDGEEHTYQMHDLERKGSRKLNIKDPRDVTAAILRKRKHGSKDKKPGGSSGHGSKSLMPKKSEDLSRTPSRFTSSAGLSYTYSSASEPLKTETNFSSGFKIPSVAANMEIYGEGEEEEDLEYTAAHGYDSNLYFDKKSCDSSSDVSLINSQESEDISDSTHSGLDTTVIPFKLQWTFGMNTKVPFMNLTEFKKNHVFFAASHQGVIYDYQHKNMFLLQGHQNAITSAAVDATGTFLATADSGPENSIIIWKMSVRKPVCVIFDANPGSGTAYLTISPNGRYIVSVTTDIPPVIKFWNWSDGTGAPVDQYVTKATYGKPINVVFNVNVQERFMVAFKRRIVFLKLLIDENKLTDPRIPEFRNKKTIGRVTDICYMLLCHELFACTTEGNILVLGNTFYVREFDVTNEVNAVKIFIKCIKVQAHRINTVNSCDGVLVTGDVKGQIKFYDRNVTLLYWCQKFTLPGIHKISFNREPRRYRVAEPATEEGTGNVGSSKIATEGSEESQDQDNSREYEILYRNMIPSDATLQRLPFIVRDFILSTNDGNLVKVRYLDNECEQLLVTAEMPVAGIDVHDEEPYLVVAYRNGRVSLYDYISHVLIHSCVLPPAVIELPPEAKLTMSMSSVQPSGSQILAPKEKEFDINLLKSATCVKFSPKSYHLAVGRGNGELFFLEPVILHAKPGYPLKCGTSAIQKLVFSMDFNYFAYYDSNRTVFLLYYSCEKDMWSLIGKIRPHSKDITDLIFSPFNPPELYSIGLDKHLVKFDLQNSVTDLQIEYRRRIDQAAVPNCFIFYPLLEGKFFLLADHEYKLKLLETDSDLYRHVFLGPAYGCYSEAPIRAMSILPYPEKKYLIFMTKKHIGIQRLPPDGNPYKYTGTVGHPTKLFQFQVSTCGRFIFTAGVQDACVLMWEIHPDAVENLIPIGGKELAPFYCLIEGGSNGWLFQEMQNLFYYMQILHQGENSQLPRVVSDKISISELPDLMRACGFYPSEFEVKLMLNDVKHRNMENENPEDEISFSEFILLYVNHRPAHGVSMDRLRTAFNELCDMGDNSEDTSTIDPQDFVDILCENGENFTPEALAKCISILIRYSQVNQDGDDGEDLVEGVISNLPEEINFDNFVADILGIDMNRTGLN